MLNCWTIVELLMALISWVNFNSPRKYFVCHNAQLTMLKACLPHDGLRFSRKCTIDFGIVNEIDAGANCSSQYFNLPTVRIPDFKHCELNNIFFFAKRRQWLLSAKSFCVNYWAVVKVKQYIYKYWYIYIFIIYIPIYIYNISETTPGWRHL